MRHAIANFNKEDLMSDLPLHKELGITLDDEREEKRKDRREDDVCKKCGATLLGALSGRPLPVEESTESNSGHTFIVTSYCPNCE